MCAQKFPLLLPMAIYFLMAECSVYKRKCKYAMYKYLSCYISCASKIFAGEGCERIDAYNIPNAVERSYGQI